MIVTCIIGSFLYANEPQISDRSTLINIPLHAGRFYGGGSWLYLQPSVSDGDLQYGTFLTLTDNPANLTAHLLEIHPSYENSFLLDFGYHFPDTGNDLQLSYMQFKGSDSEKKHINTENQFFQNFLGASYSTAKAHARQKIHQVDLRASMHYIADDHLGFQPYAGIRFSDIERSLDVNYTDLVLNPFPSNLEGHLKSCYWGLGPMLGTSFNLPTSSRFKITGHIGAAALLGSIESDISSESVRNNNQSFYSNSSDFRVVPVINTQVGLDYLLPFSNDKLALKFTFGYRTDYYFYTVKRINPFNGYVNNPSTFPASTSSNLGLGGAFAKLSILENPLPAYCEMFSHCFVDETASLSGLYFHMTNGWLNPSSTKDDLTYADLHTEGASDQNIRTSPDLTWCASFDLGYRLKNNFDFMAKYFRLTTSDSSSVTAGSDQGISSINASGPSNVLFSSANSRVRYKLNQGDLALRKTMQFANPFLLRTSFGLRYFDLKRKQSNNYLNGIPDTTTQTKSPFLKSSSYGIGLLFGIEQAFTLVQNLRFVGLFDLALAVGKIKSSLDQSNIGTIADSSNTLRIPKIQTIIPIIDAKAGLSYDLELPKNLAFNMEAGYQFTGYYRAINLVYPTLLTGLEQLNTDLTLFGPYLTLGLSSVF